MSRDNQINSKLWAAGAITTDTISEVWDFFEEAFTGLSGVTFNRDESNKVMYICLDPDKKIYITVKVAASNDGVLIEYWLGSEVCSYTDVTAAGKTTFIGYIRTVYGIAWGVASGAASLSYDGMKCIYVRKNNPAMFVGIDNSFSVSSSKTFYVLSPLHEAIEAMAETAPVIAKNLGDQKFVITNAYSCVESLKLRHLFRVIGMPSSNYSVGRIMVGTKKLFWFGRFALEYEED